MTYLPCGVIGCSERACWHLPPTFLNIVGVEDYLCERHMHTLRQERPALAWHYDPLCDEDRKPEPGEEKNRVPSPTRISDLFYQLARI